jgi:hypothetical protein
MTASVACLFFLGEITMPARSEAADVAVDAILVERASPAPETLCGLKVRLKNGGTRAVSYFKVRVQIDGKDVPQYDIQSSEGVTSEVKRRDAHATGRPGQRGNGLGRPRWLRLVSTALAASGLLFSLASLARPEEGPVRTVWPGEPIRSMGQPAIWKMYGGAGYGSESGTAGTAAYFGLYKDLLPSVAGIGLSGEGYARGVGEGSGGGLRALADLRGLMLKVGIDHSLRTGSTDLILSFNAPFRRGGLLGRGSQLRVDWIPGRGNAWQVGLLVPFERHMGRTRPRDTEVDLPPPPPPAPARPKRAPAIDEALGNVRVAARWIFQLTHVYWDDSREDRLKSLERTRREIAVFGELIRARDAGHPRGVSLTGEVARLHAEMARAFGLAAGDASRGPKVHDLARAAMAEGVVLPYDRLFGQWKRHDSLLALGARARDSFVAKLREARIGGGREDALAEVFDGYLRALDDARATRRERLGGDSRLVFLPLQLVLQPWEHDSQAEIDAIVARAVGTPFTRGNRVRYLTGQQFQVELLRTIHAAEDYHVLWVHDYSGVNAAGGIDRVGFVQTVDGYLSALTARVRELDGARSLPVYLLLVDQRYYERSHGRLFLDLLEDPLGHRLKLPPGHADLQRRADEAQEALRRAVRESSVLQALAQRHGPGRLRKLVKAHVNVVNPADFSYRTSRLVSHLPIAPDTVMRDHRKIAFRDVTEADPGRGEALYAGVGVGEQYATVTWEDRAMLAVGPALLTLKDAARRCLLQNGFRHDDVPPPLRPVPRPADFEARVARLEAGGATATALEVHNDRGFARKNASLVNSLLYTLIPPGSLIVVPSPIWTDPVWAGQLVGAALRGCHVYVIAPSQDNAPQAGFATLARSREVFSRFYEVQRHLGPQIETAGGRLRTGLYTRRTGMDESQARLREIVEGYRRYPFLKHEFPLAASFFDTLLHGPRMLPAAAFEELLPLGDARERETKLHRKTQFLATRESLSALARLAAVEGEPPEALFGVARRGPLNARDLARLSPESGWLKGDLAQVHRRLPLDVQARAVYYLTVGSLNKDTRGQVLDGEALFVLSGEWSLAAYTDFAALLGSTTWIVSQAELDRLLPPVTHLKRRISRWVRKAV